MAPPPLYYHCNAYAYAWQPDYYFCTDFNHGRQYFLIDIHLNINSRQFYKQFAEPVVQESLIILSWSTITRMLSDIDLPHSCHPRVIQAIQECARLAITDASNTNQLLIPIIVEVSVAASDELINNGSLIRESFDSYTPRIFIGPTKKSIQELKKVTVEQGLSESCVVCLEEISSGKEATLLDCLHIYHPQCIIKWLKENSVCPLCRHKQG
ncbi:hypothetical protein ACFE04_024562 [Oxalis oulophora]